jgi:hypothetical protein
MSAELPFPDVSSSIVAPSLCSDAFADIAQTGARPGVHGKFLFLGDEKLYVRGVTYGAFQPDSVGQEYHDLEVINQETCREHLGEDSLGLRPRTRAS